MKYVSSCLFLAVVVSACARSSTESGSVVADTGVGSYEQCAQILANGIYNDVNFRNNLDYQAYAVNQACSEMSSWNMATNENWDRACSSGSGGGGLSVAVPIDGVPLDFGASGSSAHESCNDAGSRAAYRKAWYQHNCENHHASTNLKTETAQVLRQVDQGLVQAWQACVTTHQYGLTCSVSKGPDSNVVRFDLAYNPAPQASSTIALSFDDFNVAPTTALPTQMGHGTQSMLFRVPDASTGLSLVVTGRGLGNGAGQESCSVQLPSFERRTCRGADLVGATSGNVYIEDASICARPDRCEAGRLRAWVHGDLDRLSGGHGADLYRSLRDGHQTVSFRADGGLDSMGPCN
jgi:hypothetical protein